MSSLAEYSRDRLDAKILLTFYGSAYDKNGYTTQKVDPFIVPDDSNYGNHANAFDYKKPDTYAGYKLNGAAIHEKAADDEHSFQFLGNVMGKPVKTILAMESNESLFLSKPEFSISLLYKADTTSPNQSGSETYFYRKNLYSLTRSWYSNGDSFNFNVVVKNQVSGVYSTKSFSFNGGNMDGLMVFTVKHEGSSLIVKIYRNGVTILDQMVQIGTDVIDMTNPNTTYIGGLPEGSSDRLDRTCRMHYFSFYDYELDYVHIAGLMKRCYGYETIFKFSNPTMFIPCQDTDILNVDTVQMLNMGGTMRARGQAMKASDHLNIVDPDLTSIYFNSNSSLYYQYDSSQRYSYPSFYNGTSFTMDLWVKTSNTTACTLVHMQSLGNDSQKPFTIRLNRSSGFNATGSVEVSDENDSFANSLRGFNIADGKWHQIKVTATTKEITLHIDGAPHGKYTKKNQSARIYTDISIMADSNNRNNVVGNLAFFSFTNTVENNIFQNLKYSYNLTYVVKGRTTLSGAAAVSDVRIYDYEFGNLVKETKTDTNGYYTVYMGDARRLHVSLMVKGDTRYNPKSRVVSPKILEEGM